MRRQAGGAAAGGVPSGESPVAATLLRTGGASENNRCGPVAVSHDLSFGPSFSLFRSLAPPAALRVSRADGGASHERAYSVARAGAGAKRS